jgi:hypothetical protein
MRTGSVPHGRGRRHHHNYRWLETLGSQTPVCVEYCGEGDPHRRLAASRDYLDRTRRLIDQIGASTVDARGR